MFNKFNKSSKCFKGFFCGFFSNPLKELLSVRYPELKELSLVQNFFVYLTMFLILFVIVTLFIKAFSFKNLENHG